MEVVITEWGLQSYIDLKARAVFSTDDYHNILRPDASLLKTDNPFDPAHPRFSNDKFWGPAIDATGIIKYGHKMKWHNLGSGKVQLRLCVVIIETLLEQKIKIKKIIDGTYQYRGRL